MNNFYENLDLKDFLEVQEVIVNFYDPVLSFKPPFIKIQTINNVD
ncbi:MAG: hypothetical protein QJQ54_02270 [Mollicutes bacterium]|nr:MAG: hypothetical protein QJQ54_02270 [Mollicutes bacterium]